MYKQLTSSQRYVIKNGLKENVPLRMIARLIGVSPSTVSREIKRNSSKTGVYIPALANEMARENRARSTRNRRTKKRYRYKVLSLLTKYQWSPEQISGTLRKEGISISHETIYQWIRKDKARGGSLYLNCRHKLKHRSRGLYKKSSAAHIPNRVSIHQRPTEVDGKRFGDIEMDTIVAKGQKSAILTLVEKSTNMCFIKKIDGGFNPAAAAKAAILLLLPYKDKLKTITTDNGFEFRDHETITRVLGIPVFFADPYASWQKGAIENTNKLIRQYIPKKSDFSDFDDDRLFEIQTLLNNRPRKKHDYISPFKLFAPFFLPVALRP